MRERSTWNREDVMKKAAALRKVADPYTMNQDHPQPPADKYLTGDPSAFAEDVHSPNTWETEYSGDNLKRNEIGMPEMRDDTYRHSEKTAREIALKKADLCIAVSQIMLGKTASEAAVEDQSVALMHLPDQDLIDTHKRLAGDEEDDDEEGQEKQAQEQDDEEQEGQEKQAGDMQQMAQQVVQDIQTGNYAAAQEQIQQLVQQAQQQQQAPAEQQAPQQQAQQQVPEQAPQQQQSQDEQVQQVSQQVQQMIQQALGQQAPQQALGQQEQAPQQQAPQQQAQQQTDEQVLDEMLGQDIEMTPSQMDISVDDLGPEDEVLRQLFAQDQEQEGEQEKKQQGQQQQKKEAVRTASTRTVGTRPSEGVSKLGGGSKGGQDSIDSLSRLWQSAPDVRDVFGIPK
jgi:hypothetical protein